MAAQTNVIAFDGAATPVSHTMMPLRAYEKDGEFIAEYRENLSAIPLSAQVRVKMTSKKLKSGIWRQAVVVDVPVMEATSGGNLEGYTAQPKVAYTDSIHVVMYSNERSSITSRRLARMLGVNIANGVTASTAADTTSAASLLFDNLISPS
jgi:hypothetical protein